MNSPTNRDKLFHEKIKFYYENKTRLHIGLKDKSWLNGTVSKVKEDSFVFKEDKKGDLLIFYEEIYRLTVFDPKE